MCDFLVLARKWDAIEEDHESIARRQSEIGNNFKPATELNQ